MNQASERDLLCDNDVRPYIIDSRYRNSVASRLLVKQNVSDPITAHGYRPIVYQLPSPAPARASASK